MIIRKWEKVKDNVFFVIIEICIFIFFFIWSGEGVLIVLNILFMLLFCLVWIDRVYNVYLFVFWGK